MILTILMMITDSMIHDCFPNKYFAWLLRVPSTEMLTDGFGGPFFGHPRQVLQDSRIAHDRVSISVVKFLKLAWSVVIHRYPMLSSQIEW